MDRLQLYELQIVAQLELRSDEAPHLQIHSGTLALLRSSIVGNIKISLR